LALEQASNIPSGTEISSPQKPFILAISKLDPGEQGRK
jgi:hypothetical protein